MTKRLQKVEFNSLIKTPLGGGVLTLRIFKTEASLPNFSFFTSISLSSSLGSEISCSNFHLFFGFFVFFDFFDFLDGADEACGVATFRGGNTDRGHVVIWRRDGSATGTRAFRGVVDRGDRRGSFTTLRKSSRKTGEYSKILKLIN